MAKKKSDLELATGSHRYRLMDGTTAVSVTSIAGLLDIDGKSSAFAGAAVKLALTGVDYRAEWRAKADRGSRLHTHMEAWLRGEDIDQTDDEAGYLDGLEKFIVDYDPETIESEQVVLSHLGYGGRFDLVARIGDETALLDLKSGSAYPIEASMQLAAYRYADGIAEYNDEGVLKGLRPMPAVDWCACVYVHEDGTYDLRKYPADQEAFDSFCDLLGVYRWAKSEQMAALVKEAKAKYTADAKAARGEREEESL